MVDVIYKKCSKCGIEKELNAENFTRNKTKKGGFDSQCKVCKYKHDREYYQKNKEKIIKQNIEYNRINREAYRIRHKKRRDKNPERCKAYSKATRERCKDKISEHAKEYYENNKEYILQRTKKRYKNNKDKVKTTQQKRYQEKKEEILEKQRIRRKEKGYDKVHRDTWNFIKKYKLNPGVCSICGFTKYVEAHHPDYSKWNEVVFICKGCHRNIHAGRIQCPEPVDLLKLI